MQLVWAKYLSLYKGNDCCRTKSSIFWWNGSFISCLGFIIWVCFEKKSSIFSLVSSAAVSCFCTKLFGICTKQNIFCTKTGGNSSIFFLDSRIFLFRQRIFWRVFPAFLSERVRFSRLPIRFLRVFSTLSVMILLFLFHQSVFFPYSFDKNPFFSEWTILPDMHLFSFRLGIFIFFRMLRQIFLSCLASFSAFFSSACKK